MVTVIDVSAHALMHVFFGYAASPLLKAGVLTDDQLHALAEGVPPQTGEPDGDPVMLDDVDRALPHRPGRRAARRTGNRDRAGHPHRQTRRHDRHTAAPLTRL